MILIRYPVQQGVPGHAPVASDPKDRKLVRLDEPVDSGAMDAQVAGHLVHGQDFSELFFRLHRVNDSCLHQWHRTLRPAAVTTVCKGTLLPLAPQC